MFLFTSCLLRYIILAVLPRFQHELHAIKLLFSSFFLLSFSSQSTQKWVLVLISHVEILASSFIDLLPNDSPKVLSFPHKTVIDVFIKQNPFLCWRDLWWHCLISMNVYDHIRTVAQILTIIRKHFLIWVSLSAPLFTSSFWLNKIL